MIKKSVELLAEPIGFDIANSDDVTQANLLNGLGRGFKMMTDGDLDTQLCYISQKLDKNAEKFLVQLTEFIKLKNG